MAFVKVQDEVERMLVRDYASRTSDTRLFAMIYADHDCRGIEVIDFFNNFDRYAKLYHLPTPETIRRCRQKVQELRPELKDENTAEAREEIQLEFWEYFK